MNCGAFSNKTIEFEFNLFRRPSSVGERQTLLDKTYFEKAGSFEQDGN